MTQKTYSTIIFDFDGTIADSLHLMVDIYNKMAHRFHAHPIGATQVKHFRSLTPVQLIHELRIPVIMIPEILFIGKRIMKKRMNELKPIKGIEQVIEKLSKKYTLGILTSNNGENVEDFLNSHSIKNIAWIHSETSLFGKDKALQKRLKKDSLTKEEVLYVGDETRDVDSCKKIGIDVASVTWGLNSRVLLETVHPTYLVDFPDELENLLLK
ncbi:carotenoid oxygenase [Candidatus Roizmanbacteria bacterium CG_4_9_14_0_2_um_filter_39_13]|uniref:Carotenoid oxygenase n=2 Tax=Candidatus Roizmaniibacteriota TaxID=1752723 RepID=A0A2M8F0Q2_9BACT|nr:MAG: carotenoid oxygenase [Candidatus Roizmanbacteria bacterium CG_4_10_14_0_2_um_filter_39_12]PJC32869.1 MAG: carotenoid oxygenase [Candidatus Roizmanbacteria bacterium CG_4_9_14_0_2_um_filter_39_13]PJE61410.1 MAG: carotenoid oxygenase [Candidatus Roizmanbacteria bacterium CG10_big_fil_rev_8_21_14_0_10_39_12]